MNGIPSIKNVVDAGYTIADGVPHLTYQHPGVDINFVWDGEWEHPIMVCPQGYGEPCADLIDLPDNLNQETFTFLASGDGLIRLPVVFQAVCLKYLITNGHIEEETV
jgi:hypothetical protein